MFNCISVVLEQLNQCQNVPHGSFILTSNFLYPDKNILNDLRGTVRYVLYQKIILLQCLGIHNLILQH